MAYYKIFLLTREWSSRFRTTRGYYHYDLTYFSNFWFSHLPKEKQLELIDKEKKRKEENEMYFKTLASAYNLLWEKTNYGQL